MPLICRCCTGICCASYVSPLRRYAATCRFRRAAVDACRLIAAAMPRYFLPRRYAMLPMPLDITPLLAAVAAIITP